MSHFLLCDDSSSGSAGAGAPSRPNAVVTNEKVNAKSLLTKAFAARGYRERRVSAFEMGVAIAGAADLRDRVPETVESSCAAVRVVVAVGMVRNEE